MWDDKKEKLSEEIEKVFEEFEHTDERAKWCHKASFRWGYEKCAENYKQKILDLLPELLNKYVYSYDYWYVPENVSGNDIFIEKLKELI